MAGVGVLLLATTACSPFADRVDVPGTKVSRADRAACEKVVAALPEQVADQERRETTGNPLGAAWGDPAIVLRCGVGSPASLGLFAQCQVANGLGWYVPVAGMNDQSRDVVMTTIERRPRIEVVLPATYRPPSTAMVDLAKAITAHTRLVKRCG